MTVLLEAALALVVVLTIAVRMLEARVSFFPTPGETVRPDDLGVEYETLAASARDGRQLHGWLLAPGGSRGSILYFHGNGGNLSIWLPVLVSLARRGYAVFAWDYRGYGLSSGRPTERGLYRDVEAMVERFWTRTRRGAPAVYWGRSLGTALAAYASTLRAPDALVLEAGFPDSRSLVRATSPVLAFFARFGSYRFPTAAFLRPLTPPVPTLVLHGDADRIVPIALGRRLFDSLQEPKRFVVVPGGDHNDPTPADPDVYWQAVDDLTAARR